MSLRRHLSQFRARNGSRAVLCACCDRPARWSVAYRGPGGDLARVLGCERIIPGLERRWGQVLLSSPR